MPVISSQSDTSQQYLNSVSPNLDYLKNTITDTSSSAFVSIPTGIGIYTAAKTLSSSRNLTTNGLSYSGINPLMGVNSILGAKTSFIQGIGNSLYSSALLSALGVNPLIATGLSIGSNFAPKILGKMLRSNVDRTGISGFIQAMGMNPPSKLTTLTDGISGGAFNQSFGGKRFNVGGKNNIDMDKASLYGVRDKDEIKTSYIKENNKHRFRKDHLIKSQLTTSVFSKAHNKIEGLFGRSITKQDIRDLKAMRSIDNFSDSKLGKATTSALLSKNPSTSLNQLVNNIRQTSHISTTPVIGGISRLFGYRDNSIRGADATIGKIVEQTIQKRRKDYRSVLEESFDIEKGKLDGIKVKDLSTHIVTENRRAMRNKNALRIGAKTVANAGTLGLLGIGATFAYSTVNSGFKRINEAISNINDSLISTEFGSGSAFTNKNVATERQRALGVMKYLNSGRDFIGSEARLISEGVI